LSAAFDVRASTLDRRNNGNLERSIAMILYRRLHGIRQFATVGLLSTTLAFGGCQLGDFTTTSTVTLSGRDVVSYLVRSAIMTPLQNFIDNAVNEFFDQIEEDNG
jgi:hypothetical protein